MQQAEARLARAHTTRQIKFTLPGPMTIVDTMADRYYGDRVKMAMAFAELLNQEARALEADGVDIIQFDEPAFNVYMEEVTRLGRRGAGARVEGLTCTTAVHICYGYGIQANIDWKKTPGRRMAAVRESTSRRSPPAASTRSRSNAAIRRCRSSCWRLLKGKDIEIGVIDVASDAIETPEEVAAVIAAAIKIVPKERLIASTNCGMAPMKADIAAAKLRALGKGAALARQRHG